MTRNSNAQTAKQRASIADTALSSQASFSRSAGLPPSMGKATCEIRARLPECVKDDWVRLAHALGTNESELLRECVMVRLYGLEEVNRMHRERLSMVAGMFAESGTGSAR